MSTVPSHPGDPAGGTGRPDADLPRPRLVDRLLLRQRSPRARHASVRDWGLPALAWLLAVSGMAAALHLWLQADTRTVIQTFRNSGEYAWMPIQNQLWSTRLRLAALRALGSPGNRERLVDFEDARAVFYHRVSLIVESNDLSNQFRNAPSYAMTSARMLHVRDELERIPLDGSEGLRPDDARRAIELLDAIDPILIQFTADLRNLDMDSRASIYDALMSRRDVFRWAVLAGWVLLSLGGVWMLRARANDTHELRQRREALEHKLAAIQTAEELIETRNSILNMVAHDLRSPLQVLMSTAETLQLRLPREQTELVALATQIDQTTEQIATHLRDLNTVAKALDSKATLDIQPLDLDALVEQAYTPMLRSLAERKALAVRIAVDGMKRGLQGDRTRITQIVGNLLDNAIKYTDQGAVNVMVETRPHTTRSVMLTFSVTDTGSGMPTPQVRQAFEPFERLASGTDPDRPGSGIGLSVVRHLVGLLDGSLEVRSTPGIGSAFVVRLPTALSDPTPAQIPPPDLCVEIRPGSATVMVVDDVPEVLQALLDAVRRQGAIGLGAGSAADALALASVHRIDLALIDYQMPVRNGLSLAAELSRRHPRMHLVMISAFPEPDIFGPQALADIGAHGYAEKPLKGTTIQQLIDTALARRVDAA